MRAQDEFGNATDWPAAVAVEVVVREVDSAPFSCVERSYTTATFAAPLHRAGLYQLYAAIDGTPLDHRPKLLQVWSRGRARVHTPSSGCGYRDIPAGSASTSRTRRAPAIQFNRDFSRVSIQLGC